MARESYCFSVVVGLANLLIRSYDCIILARIVRLVRR